MTLKFASPLAVLVLAATALPALAFTGRATDATGSLFQPGHESPARWAPVPGSSPSGVVAKRAAPTTLGGGFPIEEIEVSVAGDVDANGASDWLEAMPYFSPAPGLLSAGRVMLQRRDGNGIFDVRNIDGPSQGANFGASVAPLGDFNGDGYDDVAIGAPGFNNYAGRLYIYRGGPNGLLTPSPWVIEGAALSNFGSSVAYAGDVNGDGYDDVLVGAPGFSDAFTYQGAAYCFLGGPLGPAALPVRTWIGEAIGEYVGWAVAGGGDVNADGYADVLVGSPGYSNGESGEGRVRLFLGGPGGPSATGAWSYEANLTNDAAGRVVAFPGDMNGDGYAEFALGIPNADALATDDGRLLVFGGGPFVFFAPLLYQEEGGANNLQFGFDVAPAGDLNGDGFADLVTSMPFTEAGEGLWYMLYGSPDMALVGSFLYNLGPPGWHAGLSVSGGGDDGDGVADLLIGVLVPSIPAPGGGAAQELLGLPEGPGVIQTSGVTFDQIGYFPTRQFAQGAFEETGFGNSAVLMDINGDGYDDAIVGGPLYSGEIVGQGIVRAYYGGPDGLAGDPFRSPDWTFAGPNPNAYFAFSMANVGDVNGDGYEDLLIGAPNASINFSLEGATYLFYGGPDGPGTQPDWHSEGQGVEHLHGLGVAGAGDVNQDGYADFLIGTPYASPGGVGYAGQVELHYGSSIGPSHVPARVWTGDSPNAAMGTGSCGAGDVDGDGYPDVLINEPGYSNVESGEGRFRIYRGGAAGVEADPFFTYESNGENQNIGYTCAPAGDTNCDGYADVLIGSPQYSDAQPAEGAVLLFTGGPLAMTLAATLTPGVTDAQFGAAISTAGDLDKDGCSEILVGAPGQGAPILAPGIPHLPAGAPANGVVHLYFGDPSGLDAGSVRIFDQSSTGLSGYTGRAVAGGGDINGDGWADFVFTTPYGDGGKIIDNGLVSLMFSNIVSTGLARPTQLLRTDASAPIAHGLRSDSPNSFRVSGLGRHPTGRGKGRLEWQAKAAGSPLDGTGIQSSSVLRTGVPTAELGSSTTHGGLATGLATGQRYRVRTRYATRHPYFPRTRWFTSERDGIDQSDLRTFGPTGAVAVENPAGVPGALAFAGPRPNPLAGTCTLSFTLPTAGRVTIDAYDAQGRRVARVHEGDAAAGPSTVTWDGRDDSGRALPRGLYFLRLTAGNEQKTVKAVLTL